MSNFTYKNVIFFLFFAALFQRTPHVIPKERSD